MQPDQGEIYYNRVLLNGVPLEKRKIGYIFQKLYLFPHLNVFSNITFGLHHKKDRESIIKTKQIISILGIEPLLSRNIQNISGGEQQKVAIARTILTEPLLLLMDEPFTNLDITSKLVLTQAVKTTANIFKIPTVYVTHQPNEALALADKIVILDDGKIIEEGTRDEVMSRPKQQFTRSFMDTLGSNNKQAESRIDGENLQSNFR
jgi:ABC-type sugar transport system ATPase subunit